MMTTAALTTFQFKMQQRRVTRSERVLSRSSISSSVSSLDEGASDQAVEINPEAFTERNAPSQDDGFTTDGPP